MDREAHTHPDAAAVNPAGPEPRAHDLPWEVCTAVRAGYRPRGLPRRQRRGKGVQKSAEAVVAAGAKRRGTPPLPRRAKGRIF